MAGDTRNIRLNVDIDGDSRGATKAAKSLDDTAKAADKAGSSLKQMGVDAKQLNAEIAQSNKRIAELRQHLVEVGNDRGVRKALRGEESWLRELTKIQSSQSSQNLDVPTPHLGRTPVTGAAAAGVVMGLAPFVIPLGAMVAGAVAGTIGTGGIAGGIAMASRTPQVQRAAQDFKESIAKEFFSGGDAFAGPIAAGLRQLEGAFKGMELPDTFAKMAPHVTTIARGFSDLGTNVMPGLNKAFDRMGPFAEAAADGFSNLGGALSTFMDDVTSSEGTIEGLEAMFSMLSGTIVITGKMLNGLSDAFHVFNDVTADLAGFGASMFANDDMMRSFFLLAQEGMLNVADSTSSFTQRAIEAANAQIVLSDANRAAGEEWHKIQERIKGATKAQDEYFARAMAVPQANDALEASFDAFTESLKENGRSFDDNTEKGRANREALRDMISAAQDLRTAQINSGQSMTDVNRKYDETIAKIEAIANKAGVSADELRDMAGDYYVNIYRKELTHKVTYFSNHDLADTRKGDFRAAGGPVQPGVPYVINERGMETVTFPANGTVHPAHLTPMMGGGSGGTVRHVLDIRINGHHIKDELINDAMGRGVPESTIRVAYP
jgi:methyl-accepting chemotaxis protein